MLRENDENTLREIAQSEEKFRGIASAARDAIFMIDEEGAIVYVNTAGEALFGYGADEIMGGDLHALLAPPEYKERYEKGLAHFRAMGTGAVIGGIHELDALKKDGERITIELSLSAQKLKGKWHAIGICRDITARKRLERTLHEREEFLRVIFTNIDMAVFVVGVSDAGEFRFMEINPAHESLTGLKNTEIAGKEPHEFLPREVADAVIANYRRCIETGSMTEYEESIPFQGRDTWWITRLMPLADSAGRIHTIIGASIHITDRKEAERRLMNTLDFTRRILENSPIGIIIYNKEGECITANQSAVDIIGAPGLLDILNQNFHRLPSWRESGLYEKALESQRTGFMTMLTTRMRTTFGRSIWIEARLMPFESGGDAYLLLIINDVTGIKESERVALEQKEFISILLDTIPDPVFFKDQNGVYLGCNRAFERFTGLDRTTVVGKTVYDVAPRELADEYARRDAELVANPGSQHYEFRVRRADGKHRDVIFNKASFSRADGGVAGIVGTIIDITESKSRERFLQEISLRDELTGLGNRRSYNEMVQVEWNRAARDGALFSLLFIDIDYFKRYNDRFGHHQGDECLAKVAAALKASCLRPADFVARYGGEEFAVLLPGTDAPGALKVAERLHNAVRDLALGHPDSLAEKYVTVSIGIGTAKPGEGLSMADLFRAADKALYAAKEHGRNRIESAPR